MKIFLKIQQIDEDLTAKVQHGRYEIFVPGKRQIILTRLDVTGRLVY